MTDSTEQRDRVAVVSDTLDAVLGAQAGVYEALDEALADALAARPEYGLVQCRLTLAARDGGTWVVKATTGGWQWGRPLDAEHSTWVIRHALQSLDPSTSDILQEAAEALAGEIAERTECDDVTVEFPEVMGWRVVVDQVDDPGTQMDASDARDLGVRDFELGDELGVQLEHWHDAVLVGLLDALRANVPLEMADDGSATLAMVDDAVPDWAARVDEALTGVLPRTYMSRVPTSLLMSDEGELVLVEVVETSTTPEGSLRWRGVDVPEALSWLESAVKEALYDDIDTSGDESLGLLLPVGEGDVRPILEEVRLARPIELLEDQSGRELTYHAEGMALLALPAGPPVASGVDDLGTLADEHGFELPASVAEWASLPGADAVLARCRDYEDRAFIRSPRLVELDDSRRLLVFYSENQDNFRLGVLLDGSDDPPVLINAAYAAEPGAWMPFADSFSDSVYSIVFDGAIHSERSSLEWAGGRVAAAAQPDLPRRVTTRVPGTDGSTIIVERWGGRARRVVRRSREGDSAQVDVGAPTRREAEELLERLR